jgi:15-cis-phytoene desaturase
MRYSKSRMSKKVVVIGAGLAGLSCAVELLERGYTPIVLEAKPYVGGRTASWVEQGMHIESGLHRYLGFYTHVPALLRKAGLNLRDVVFWEDAVEMRLPHGPRAVYHASVHRPIRTLLSYTFFNNHYLNWGDKAQLTRMFIRGLLDYILRPNSLKNITVDEYAQKHHVGARAHDRALVALTEGIFFTPPSTYAAYNLFGLIGPYLLHFWRFRIGGFKGGMTDVMAEPLAEFIRRQGGEVYTDTEVMNLLVKNGRVIGVKTKGKEIRADWTVLASSLHAAQELTQPHFADESWCKDWHQLALTPVVTLHIELSKPALPKDRTTFGPTSPLAAFAEQSRTTFSASKGRLSIILSPPQDFMHGSSKDTLAKVVPQLQALDVDIAKDVIDVRKVVLPMDFYSLSVGNEKLRPSQRTPVTGLTLAGDYTKQRYLGTMEGAVYSGKLAAEIVAKSL